MCAAELIQSLEEERQIEVFVFFVTELLYTISEMELQRSLEM